MTQRTGRFRARARHKLSKKARNRGKVKISRILQKFGIGDKVIINHEPAVHKGMPHPKFKNRAGQVVRKQGSNYIIQIKDGNKAKQLISAAVHLFKVNKA